MIQQSRKPLLRGMREQGVDNAASPPVALSPEEQHALAQRIHAACADWQQFQMSLVLHHEAEFSLRLARCQTPSEAVGLCGEWLAHRLDSAVVMHHRLLELWLESAGPAIGGLDRAGQPRTAHQPGSSP